MAGRKPSSKTHGSAWAEEDTQVLLSIWDERAIEEQMENPKVINGSICQSVSDELLNQGFEKHLNNTR